MLTTKLSCLTWICKGSPSGRWMLHLIKAKLSSGISHSRPPVLCIKNGYSISFSHTIIEVNSHSCLQAFTNLRESWFPKLPLHVLWIYLSKQLADSLASHRWICSYHLEQNSIYNLSFYLWDYRGRLLSRLFRSWATIVNYQMVGIIESCISSQKRSTLNSISHWIKLPASYVWLSKLPFSMS